MKNSKILFYPKSIWNEKQNKCHYIVDDIKRYYPYTNEILLYAILLNRGVFKWFAARRKIIKLKNEWKDEIRKLQHKKKDYEKGYLHALEKCRKQIRGICHMERWVAPDNDRETIKFLEKLESFL